MLVAGAALAAPRDDDRLTSGKVRHNLPGLRLPDDRPLRHRDDEVLAGTAGAVAAASGCAVLGVILFLIAELFQRVEVAVDDKDDVPAPSAVPAVRAARGDVLFAAEGNGAVAAVSGFDKDGCAIDEHKASPFPTDSDLLSIVPAARPFMPFLPRQSFQWKTPGVKARGFGTFLIERDKR